VPVKVKTLGALPFRFATSNTVSSDPMLPAKFVLLRLPMLELMTERLKV
jgi:hypothetical protein